MSLSRTAQDLVQNLPQIKIGNQKQPALQRPTTQTFLQTPLKMTMNPPGRTTAANALKRRRAMRTARWFANTKSAATYPLIENANGGKYLPVCHSNHYLPTFVCSKHMDKHDRPYKCSTKGCEKLQGFTYSGGLFRHEREVHKMHGGTKKSLFCPFPDCKRSSGAGFTRKENLAEHIRRVHRITSISADLHGLAIQDKMVRPKVKRSPIHESRNSKSSLDQLMKYRDEDTSLKRKRGVSDSENSDDEMSSEIKRLRQENEEKDSRIKQLERTVIALQQENSK